ncbi:MAG: IS3 family transposase [Nitrospirales bacterium]
MVSPRARRHAARAACARGLSQRRAAWLCTTPRSGIRYEATGPHRDRRLAQALRGVAKRYPQWGYRLAGSFLRHRGWRVNFKRLYRVWGQCGLQVPRRKSRKKVVTGATLQPTARQKNEVWSWDFVHDATTVGEAFRCLTVKDEATCFCLAIEVERAFSHQHVLKILQRLVNLYGAPRYIRSDNGPELCAQPVLAFCERHRIISSRIMPGKPWQNGSNESFNGTFRRECLDAESFRHVMEAQVVIESWRRRYNQERPHSTLGYQTPASVYWGNGRDRSSSEGRSGPAPKNSTHKFDHKATIGEEPDSEVGGKSSNRGTEQNQITRKT